MEEAHFEWLYTEDILEEYKALLKRFKVRRSLVGKFINLLREAGTPVTVRKGRSFSPDPSDDPFCECAEAGSAAFIVTLNTKDFPQPGIRARIIVPGDDLPSENRPRKRSR
jgi:predicted nucleic acid-binding protein